MSRLLTITFTTAAFRTEAAYGSLRPPPTRRLRRAHLHLSYSMALARLLDTIQTKKLTLVLFQPFWLGAGVRGPLIDRAPALQAPHRLPKPQVRLATRCLRGEVRRGVK